MGNTLDQEIFQYIARLTEHKKKSMLQFLKTFAGNDQETFERISIEQYNVELEESEQQIEAGQFTTQENLEKEMQEW